MPFPFGKGSRAALEGAEREQRGSREGAEREQRESKREYEGVNAPFLAIA